MSKMKLTGEYEFTDHGVIISGKIHDTHIAELREKFTEYPGYTPRVFPGTTQDMAGVVRDIDATRYKVLGPRWFDNMKSRGIVTQKDIDDVLEVKHLGVGIPMGFSFQASGLLYEDGASAIMVQRKLTYRDDQYRRHSKIVKQLNAGWVFDKVERDGTFTIELYGLVNRHIMTMILGAATKYAKMLDSELVRRLADKKDNLRPASSGWY